MTRTSHLTAEIAEQPTAIEGTLEALLPLRSEVGRLATLGPHSTTTTGALPAALADLASLASG